MQKDKEKVTEKENKKAKDNQEPTVADPLLGGLSTGGGSHKPEKSHKKLFIIIGVVVSLCTLLGVLFFTSLFDLMMGDVNPDSEKNAAEVLQAKSVTYLPIPELTINLKKTSSRSRTLTASFVLALENENVRKNVNHFIPMIQDQFHTFLREMDVSDLEGMAGIERVSQEMLIRINRVVAPFSVTDVLVQKFYIR